MGSTSGITGFTIGLTSLKFNHKTNPSYGIWIYMQVNCTHYRLYPPELTPVTCTYMHIQCMLIHVAHTLDPGTLEAIEMETKRAGPRAV